MPAGIIASMNESSWFTYCPHCSAGLVEFLQEGLPRRKCPACGWIQYRNPTVGVAVVLIEGDRLLFGRRRGGGWCIPCGHVEWSENVEDAAIREFAEETGLIVELEEIVAVKSNFHNPTKQTVGIWYRGRRVSGHLQPGGDLVELAFCKVNDPPQLKFPTDREVVTQLCQERNQG